VSRCPDTLIRQVVAGVLETGKGKTILFDGVHVFPWHGMFEAFAYAVLPGGRATVVGARGRTPEWAARCLGHRIGRVG
jgi:hypothetical protein